MRRRPLQLRHWAAALLALLAPLAQQRPALLAAAAAPALHHASPSHATPGYETGGATGGACPEHAASHGDTPAPDTPECCELALIPAVVTPWLAPRVTAAGVVFIANAVVRDAPQAGAVRYSQTRLPFATAPPDVGG